LGQKNAQRAGSVDRLALISLAVIGLHAAALWLLDVENPTYLPGEPLFVLVVTAPRIPPSPVKAPTVAGPAKPIARATQAPRSKKPTTDLEIPTTKLAATTPGPTLPKVEAPSITAATTGATTAKTPATGNGPERAPDRNASSAGIETSTGTDKNLPSVQLPSSNADYLNNPAPVYPALSRRLGEQGKVVLRVLIGNDGTALQASIHQSSGFERLDQAALRAVMGWRYVPGQRGGVAQDMWFNVPVNYSLNE